MKPVIVYWSISDQKCIICRSKVCRKTGYDAFLTLARNTNNVRLVGWSNASVLSKTTSSRKFKCQQSFDRRYHCDTGAWWHGVPVQHGMRLRYYITFINVPFLSSVSPCHWLCATHPPNLRQLQQLSFDIGSSDVIHWHSRSLPCGY